MLLASGEAYGWTALRPVLIDSGLFDGYPPEKRRELMNSVATMGIAGNALCKLPLGLILDRFGPRVTSVIGSFLLIAGCTILALCDKNSETLPVAGYFLLGIAGPFIQMPCFQFSELFGARKASAMAYLITCFELSTGVFWVFGELNSAFGLERKQLFLGYLFVGVYCLITGLFFWPDLPYRCTPPPPQPNERRKPGPQVLLLCCCAASLGYSERTQTYAERTHAHSERTHTHISSTLTHPQRESTHACTERT